MNDNVRGEEGSEEKDKCTYVVAWDRRTWEGGTVGVSYFESKKLNHDR